MKNIFLHFVFFAKTFAELIPLRYYSLALLCSTQASNLLCDSYVPEHIVSLLKNLCKYKE